MNPWLHLKRAEIRGQVPNGTSILPRPAWKGGGLGASIVVGDLVTVEYRVAVTAPNLNETALLVSRADIPLVWWARIAQAAPCGTCLNGVNC